MIILLIILGIALLIATIRDVQIREVPDTLSYGLIVLGLLSALIVALLASDIQIFLESLYGFLIGALVGIMMYYGRQWGGGDAKLIMGVGAILGFSRSNVQLLEFLLLLTVCGAVYGLAVTLYLALVIKRKEFWPAFVKFLRTPKVHRLRIGLVLSGVIVLVALIFVDAQMRLVLGFLLASLYILVYSWIFMKVVESHLMLKEYPTTKLTEGDWVVREVKVGKKVIVPAKNTGITNEQIQMLKKLKVKSVLVKEGIPFVPGFLLAFIVLLLSQYAFGGIVHLLF